jgi:superoxide reductase
MKLGEKIQSADWKTEKHVPVIELPDVILKGAAVDVKVSVGKEIPHPNTQEHHIRWIQLYFQPMDSKFVFQVGQVEFPAHGEAEAFTNPAAQFSVTLNQAGTLIAVSLCNIHGLWESAAEITF